MKGSDHLLAILHQRGLEIGQIHRHALTKTLSRRNARNVQDCRHTPVSEPGHPLDRLMIRLDVVVSPAGCAPSNSLRVKGFVKEMVARSVLTVKLHLLFPASHLHKHETHNY
jgi:hypothetical protein